MSPAKPSPPTVVTRHVATSPERVFAVVCDAWLIPVWLVGAAHIRDVDVEWPSVGARLHHSIGAWPLLISDSTEVVEIEPPRRIVLRARMWPAGEAMVEMRFEPHESGCTVVMTERAARGPAFWVDNPVQRLLLRHRNVESLARLAAVAEKRRA